MELLAIILAAFLGAAIWHTVSFHKRQNEEFLERKRNYENQEAKRQAEEAQRKEEARIEQMTEEELDAEFELDDESTADEEDARFRDIVREVQEISDAASKKRWWQ